MSFYKFLHISPYLPSHLNLAHENVHSPARRARSSHHRLMRCPRDTGEHPLFDYDGSPGTRDPLRRAQVGPLDLEHHQVPLGLDILWVLKTEHEKRTCYTSTNRTAHTFICAAHTDPVDQEGQALLWLQADHGFQGTLPHLWALIYPSHLKRQIYECRCDLGKNKSAFLSFFK